MRTILIAFGAFCVVGASVFVYFFMRPAPILRFSWIENYQGKNFQAVLRAYEEEMGVKTTYTRYQEEDYTEFLAKTATVPDDEKLADIVIVSPRFFKQNPDIFLPITDFIHEHNVRGTMVAQFVDAAASHPDHDSEYIGLPLMGGTTILVYRRDLFEDERHKAMFAERYGYELAVPRLWGDMRDVAEYFTNPEQGMVGFSMPFSDHDGSLSKSLESFWYTFAEPSNKKHRSLKEILGSDNAIRTYMLIHSWAPFLSKEAITGGSVIARKDFAEGKAAMALLDSEYLILLENPAFNAHKENTGYAIVPAGEFGRTTSASGAVMGIINHDKSKEALKFFAWFNTSRAQQIWTDAGGLSVFNRTLQSQKFLQDKPYHPIYKDALAHTVPISPLKTNLEELTLVNTELQDFLLNPENHTPETSIARLLEVLQ